MLCFYVYHKEAWTNLYMLWLQYPGNKAEKEGKWEIPALLRVKIWFGLEKHEHEWHKMQTEGELAVFAETVSVKSYYSRAPS